MKKIRIAWAVTAAVGVFLAGCSAFQTGPGATVEKFYMLVEKGEITQATALVSATLQAQLGGKMAAALAEQGNKIRQKQGVKSFSATEEITGETATVTSDVVYGNSSTERENWKLVREDGQWRITGSK